MPSNDCFGLRAEEHLTKAHPKCYTLGLCMIHSVLDIGDSYNPKGVSDVLRRNCLASFEDA